MNPHRKDANKSAPHESDIERAAHHALAHGDRNEVVGILYRGYGTRILRSCHAVVRDDALAEDVYQNVWIDVLEDLPKFDITATFLPWLHSIARHRALDELKMKGRRERRVMCTDPLPEKASPQRSSEDMVTQAWLTSEVEECLEDLPEELHQAVILRAFEGMSYPEMVALIGGTPAMLEARVRRGFILVRKCLNDRGIDL
jgi:RNA polymerase sigma-70 factor, ECF subfamily